MEIRNCPECHDDVVPAGLALWEGHSEEVEVFACVDADCGWVGVEFEYATQLVARTSAA